MAIKRSLDITGVGSWGGNKMLGMVGGRKWTSSRLSVLCSGFKGSWVVTCLTIGCLLSQEKRPSSYVERQTRVQPNRPKVRKLAFSGSRLTYRYSKFLHPRKNQLCSTVYKSIIINLDSMCPFSILHPILQLFRLPRWPQPQQYRHRAHGRRGVRSGRSLRLHSGLANGRSRGR